jgi:predicted ArsR family transcriptional regulator
MGADLGERHRADRAQGNGLRLALESALSEQGFEPWHDDHSTVRMRNCPFHHLAELQPDVVCHMNLALIQGLIAGLGADSLNPVLNPEPEHCCVTIPAATP